MNKDQKLKFADHIIKTKPQLAERWERDNIEAKPEKEEKKEEKKPEKKEEKKPEKKEEKKPEKKKDKK